MNRLTVGIFLSFTVILSVTALNYTPDPLSSTTNCEYNSTCGSDCTKPGCAQKAKACGSSCAKPCCAQKAKACGLDCTKLCCVKKAKACGPDCTKPCCAEKKRI